MKTVKDAWYVISILCTMRKTVVFLPVDHFP